MKCELCNSDYREPEERLCEPCLEAVARLWNISRLESQSVARAAVPVGESMPGSVLKTASPPHALR
jgi:hypothetical protein